MGKYWHEWIAERFGDRVAMTREDARLAFWPDVPVHLLEEFFEFIETEYDLDSGLLRPEDNLDLLTAPVKTRNPFRWLAVEPRIEDTGSELGYQIGKRARKFGLDHCLPVFTVDQYVRIWCGVNPNPPTNGAIQQALGADSP